MPRANGRHLTASSTGTLGSRSDRRLFWHKLKYSQHTPLPNSFTQYAHQAAQGKDVWALHENSRKLSLNQHHHQRDVNQVQNVQQKSAFWNLWTVSTSTNYSCLVQADVSTSHQNINQRTMTGILINYRSSQIELTGFQSQKRCYTVDDAF